MRKKQLIVIFGNLIINIPIFFFYKEKIIGSIIIIINTIISHSIILNKDFGKTLRCCRSRCDSLFTQSFLKVEFKEKKSLLKQVFRKWKNIIYDKIINGLKNDINDLGPFYNNRKYIFQFQTVELENNNIIIKIEDI